MPNDIHAFVKNADDFDAVISKHIKNNVPALGIAHVSFFDVVAAFPQGRILCQSFEPFGELAQVDISLRNTPFSLRIARY